MRFKAKYKFFGDYVNLIDVARFEYIGNIFYTNTGRTTNLYGRRIDDAKQVVYNDNTLSLTVQNYNRDRFYPMKNQYIQDLIDKGLIKVVEDVEN